jgi:hypothetical protein
MYILPTKKKLNSILMAMLTFQCWPQCTIQTFHSSQAASLSAPYIHECVMGIINLKPLHPVQ